MAHSELPRCVGTVVTKDPLCAHGPHGESFDIFPPITHTCTMAVHPSGEHHECECYHKWGGDAPF